MKRRGFLKALGIGAAAAPLLVGKAQAVEVEQKAQPVAADPAPKVAKWSQSSELVADPTEWQLTLDNIPGRARVDRVNLQGDLSSAAVTATVFVSWRGQWEQSEAEFTLTGATQAVLDVFDEVDGCHTVEDIRAHKAMPRLCCKVERIYVTMPANPMRRAAPYREEYVVLGLA